jgi:MarR family transcriptional regulator for hemolysin
LVIIDRTGGTFTQQEIADASGLDKTNILRIIDNLSEKKLVIRVQKPDDRRAYLIQLTDNGKNTMPRVNTAIKELNKVSFSGLSNHEVEAFYKTIHTINANLAGFPDDGLGFSIKDKS